MSPWMMKPVPVETVPVSRARRIRVAMICGTVVMTLLAAAFTLEHILNLREHIAGVHRLGSRDLAMEIAGICVWVFLVMGWFLIFKFFAGLAKKRL